MPVISETPLKLFQSAEESEKPERAEIEGTLPSYLHGTSYMRVGPAKFEFDSGFSLKHWLDGYALLQRFDFTNDSILFTKKYLESDAYKKSKAIGFPVVNEFATAAQPDPNKGFFSRIVSTLLPEFTDNNYSTLFKIDNDIFATCDTCFFRKVDGKTLESDEKCDGNKLFGLNGQSAHPLVDSKGDMYNIGFNLFPSSKYSFIKMPKANSSKEMLKKAKTVATFSSRWTGALSINHSFGMTDNYLICIEQPVTVSVSRIASSLVKGETLKDVLEWRPQEKNRFIIVEKNSGKVLKTEFISAESFYFMHIINCYEENNQLVIDLISYESPNFMDSLFLNQLRGTEVSSGVDLPGVQRFIIPLILDLKTVQEGVELLPNRSPCSAIRKGNQIILQCSNLTERGIEMPMINKKFYGKKYRYVYASGTFNESCYSHSITKTDVLSGETYTWKEGDYFYPGEPLFVSNSEQDGEEDGVLICPLTDSRVGHPDFLVFLNPRNMEEIARAKFKSHIPSALHGLFLKN